MSHSFTARVARIGRVKMKGGADVTILRKPMVGEMESQLMSDSRHLATRAAAPLVGYVVVTWAADMAAGTAIKYDYESGGIYPESIPEFARCTLARSMRSHGLSD